MTGSNSIPFKSIPLVDISGLYSDNHEERLKAAEQLGKAAKEIGFLYVKGHKVSEESILRIRQTAKEYFAQPMETKMENYIGLSKNHKGYVPRGEEVFEIDGITSASSEPDLKETFDMGFELPEDDPLVLAGTPLMGPNNWPALPGFREAASQYFDEVFDLGKTLFRGFSLSLGLDEEFFVNLAKKPPATLRMIHYPCNAGTDDVQGVGAHTDYEWFTILQADEPGLEVLNSAGEWIDASPIEGAFVVNIGDMYELMTNGLFVATAHRVRKVDKERYSFPLFYACDYHTQVAPLPQFNNGVKQREATSFGDHTWGGVILTHTYLKKKLANGEITLPKTAVKQGSYGNFAKNDAATES